MPAYKRAWQYLKGTVDEMMMMRPGKDEQLAAFVDASGG